MDLSVLDEEIPRPRARARQPSICVEIEGVGAHRGMEHNGVARRRNAHRRFQQKQRSRGIARCQRVEHEPTCSLVIGVTRRPVAWIEGQKDIRFYALQVGVESKNKADVAAG